MKRNPIFLAGSIFELVRFAGLAVVASAIFDFWLDPGSALLFRALIIPQLLFATAFFFLWRDGAKYEPFKALAAVGKTLCSLSEGLLATVWILGLLHGNGSQRITPVLGACLGILLLYDVASALYCALARGNPANDALPEPTVIPMVGMSDEQG